MQIERSDFSLVLPVWAKELWPERTSTIEPASAIAHTGKIELDINQLKPCFWRATDDTGTIGVVSACMTSQEHCRSRGLWVAPAVRRRGLGWALMNEVEKWARSQNARMLWTMPRSSALKFYESYGFEVYDYTDAYEYGPHTLAQKILYGGTAL